MSIKTKLPLIRSENKIFRLLGYIAYSFLGFFVFMLFIGIMVSITGNEEYGKKEYVSVSFEEFDKLFGMDSKLTDYQKNVSLIEILKGSMLSGLANL